MNRISNNITTGLCLCASLWLLSACSSMDFNYKTNKSKERPSERRLATLSLQTKLDDQTRQIHAYKIKKGYALKTPVSRSEKSQSDMVLLKNKEYKWFAGMQWSWGF